MSANFDTYLYDQADKYMSSGLSRSGEECWEEMLDTIECRLFDIKDDIKDLIKECKGDYGFSHQEIVDAIYDSLKVDVV